MRSRLLVAVLVAAAALPAGAAVKPKVKKSPVAAEAGATATGPQPAAEPPKQAPPKKEKPADKPAADKAVEVRAAIVAGFQFFAGRGGGGMAPDNPQLVANAEAQIRAQFAPQLRGIVSAELRFVRTVCQPTPEQAELLVAAAKGAGEQAIKKLAAQQAQMQRGIAANQHANPSAIVAEGLAKAVAEHLPSEQAAAYENQLQERAAARKEAALKLLVADIDREVLLTSEQRDAIRQALLEHWDDRWTNHMEYFIYGPDYVPKVPDGLVLPSLTDWQKDVWKQTQRPQHTIWGWQGMMFGNMIGLPEENELGDNAFAPAEPVPAVGF